MNEITKLIDRLEDIGVAEPLLSGQSEQTLLDVVAFLEGLKPRLVTEADFWDAAELDDFGYLPVWQEKRYSGEVECTGIEETRLRIPKYTRIERYWTAKPTREQMAETPWPGEVQQ